MTLVSLVTASVLLPLFLHGLTLSGVADAYTAARGRMMNLYSDRIESRSQDARGLAHARLKSRIKRDLRRIGSRAEWAAVNRCARKREIGGATAQKLIRELNLQEVRTRG